MAKHEKRQALAIAARLAPQTNLVNRAFAALEKEAIAVYSAETGKCERSLQIVSSPQAFSAIIRHGKKTFQFEGDSFAVTTHE